MKHLLPPLPYDHAALEPHIDAHTMMLHHDKHHAAYVTALNTALEKFPELQKRTAAWLLLNLAKVPEKIRAAVHHNAGGHVNHSLFWRAMSPKGDRAPTGLLADAIKRDFGGLEQFKTQFDDAGVKLFGSGWVWLARAQKDGGKLQVYSTSGHDNPLMQGHFPLLVNDVWEHAYYLKHENRRADYLKGWWSVANWKEASGRFENSDHGAEDSWESEGGSLLKATA
ncbi:MAG TPA: superoxide dismutase [Bradyrhizobium sp.]|jgi:superoxide dismutase, Fe-Mn family|nr:superoxide dismutase [Bradyrhizobium sp.]